MVNLADVLGLEVVARSAPTVVVGSEFLSAPLQCVYTTEEMRLSHVPRGRHLLLTRGCTFPDAPQEIDALFASLADAGVSGLVVLLGIRFKGALPPVILHAAERHRVPLVTLEPPARLSEIAAAVNLAIADGRLAALTATEEVHQVFTELALEGASPWEVVHQIALLSGRPVVLENLAHQMLAYHSTSVDPARLLAGWEERSRQIATTTWERCTGEDGWLTAAVGARGKNWGRLLLLPATATGRAPDTTTTAAQSTLPYLILKRGAETLALNQLIGASEEYVERQAHAALLQGVLAHSLTSKEVALRSCAMGLPLENSQLIGIAVGQRGSRRPSRADVCDLEGFVVTALQRHHVRALVAALDNGIVSGLVAIPAREDAMKIIDSVSLTVRGLVKEHFGQLGMTSERESKLVITVGTPVGAIQDARRSLMCALETLQVALRSDRPMGTGPNVSPRDLRLTGLLRLLHDDSRVQAFVENEIGPLLAYDARHGTRLASVLACYLDAGRNKTAAAEAAQLSRPSLYERLERIERILGIDLDDPRSCLSLQVATQALRAIRQHSAL